MKVTDYIVSFLESQGIEYVFGYQGGMITHLVDSLSKSKKIKFVQCYHEQSAAIAAEGYARASGKFGVAISTSGPGATNMLTGIANAYFDSIPVLYITGQVNSYEYKYDRKIRQRGFQETDVVSIAKPVTKYAALVDTVENLKNEFEIAMVKCLSGRKGSVLLDIPMDVQRADIEDDLPLIKFEKEDSFLSPENIQLLADIVKHAERPIILAGGGVISSRCKDKLMRFATGTGMPVCVSLMGKGSFDETSSQFVGMVGSYGNRCANIVMSNADVVLVLGSRLDLRQTGNRKAKVLTHIKFIHIDIDNEELDECELTNHLKFNISLDDFFENYAHMFKAKCSDDWRQYVDDVRIKYSQLWDIESNAENKGPYIAINKINELSENDCIYTVDIGQNQMWAAQMLHISKLQSFYTSGGLAPMGYGLHSAIGAAFACPKKHIICIIGDGGFHIALQSLLLISQYKLNISVVVLNNEALGMITQFQTLYFNSNMVGTTFDGGYQVPDLMSLAKGFYLDYQCISNANEMSFSTLKAGTIYEIRLGGLTSVVPKLEYDKELYDMIPRLDVDILKNIYRGGGKALSERRAA